MVTITNQAKKEGYDDKKVKVASKDGLWLVLVNLTNDKIDVLNSNKLGSRTGLSGSSREAIKTSINWQKE